MRNTGIAALALLLVQAGVPAEACDVQGVVKDSSNLPVPGVRIVLENGGAAVAAMTEADGGYCLTGVAPGEYTVWAELHAFAGSRHHIRVDASGAPVICDLVLTPSFQENLVVSATGTEKRLEDVPVRTELITRQSIDLLPVRTLAEAVEYTTGIRVENKCQNCNFSQIRLLGLEGAYTQILVDGQPLLSSLAHVYGIEHIPSRFVDRIEIVKGGGSALYGAGSVGGVVNVISREPVRGGGVVGSRLTSMAGEPHFTLDGALDWTSASRQTFVTAFGQLDRVEPLDLTDDGFTEVSRRSLEAFGLRLGHHALESRAKLILNLNGMYEDRRGGDRLDLPPDQAQIAESTQSKRWAGGATWYHWVGSGLDYRLAVSFADTGRDSYYGSGMDPNAYGQSDDSLFFVDSQVNHHLDRHTLSWGGQWTRNALHDEQPAYDRFLDETYTDLGAFVQDDWSFASGWEVLLGLRVDSHSAVEGAIASPRVALMFSPRSDIDLRASVARGFRAPQVFDEDLHILASGGEVQVVRNADDLYEEGSWSHVLSAEWTPELGSGRGKFELSLFHTRLTDLFQNVESDDPETPELEFLKVNLGGARVYGLELNAGWALGTRWTVEAGFVVQRSRFDDPEPDFGSEEFLRTPEAYGQLAVTYREPKLADLFLGVRHTGAMEVPHYAGYVEEDRLETTPEFVTLDASASRRVGLGGDRALVLTLAGRNLTNEYQEDLDQGPDRDAGYVYGPRYPRAISLSARVEF